MDLISYSISEARDGLRSRQFSCHEYVTALLDEAEQRSALNCFASLDRDGLFRSAKDYDSRPRDRVLGDIPLAFKGRKMQAEYQRVFDISHLDALVFPTTPLTARPIGEDETVELAGRRVPAFATFIRHTDYSSNAGLPGISIPAGVARNGMPVGIEIDGREGDDRRLLAIAEAIERVLPPHSSY